MNRIYGLILSVALICTFFSSCIYENLPDLSTTPTGTEGKCYMSLSFKLIQQRRNNLKSRTFQPSYADEDYERTVSDFRIFIVNKENLDDPVIEIEDVPMVDNLITGPFEIKQEWMNGYLLYVVANAAGSGFTPDLSSGKAFLGTYILGSSEACARIWTKNNFLMVNMNNEAKNRDEYIAMRKDDPLLENPLPVSDDPTPYGGVPIKIDENKKYNYANPYRMSINLERVAAKIIVDCSKENFDFNGYQYKNSFHDVRVTGVALINAANSFNLVQQWQIACYQGEKYFNYDWDDFRKWDGIPENSPYGYPWLWAVTPMSDINTVPSQVYYNQIKNFIDTNKSTLYPEAEQHFMPLDAEGKATMYCLENTSPLYLDFMKNFNKETDFVTENSILHETLENCMRNRVTGILFRVRAKIKDDSHDNDDLIKDPDEGQWDKVQSRTNGNDGYKTFYCYDDLVYNRLTELLKEKPELKDKGINTSSTIKELRAAGVKVYENGYMYYMHWIADQNYKYSWSCYDSAGERLKFKYYAVLRNTCYVIEIKDISEIGMDLPGREVIMKNHKLKEIIEGEEYMLMPISISDHISGKDYYLDNLKNNAL